MKKVLFIMMLSLMSAEIWTAKEINLSLNGTNTAYYSIDIDNVVGEEIDNTGNTGDKTFEELLTTEESRQTIFTPESIDELRRFFDGELEGWRVWLHPVQRKLAYKEYNGPAMVRGGAGTGKCGL